ncbi:MAG: hypothetical protein KKC18_12900 [Chloroflexi bacterium]|nr:hypothetical protein [Chloroflexota bacterium]
MKEPTVVVEEVEPSVSKTSFDPERQARIATWLQFPRRVVLLLLAFGIAQGFIVGLRVPLGAMAGGLLPGGREVGWSFSWTMQRSVIEIIRERLPNTLLLVMAALLLAALLALVAVLVTVLVHWLKERAGTLGSILEGMGRLLAFGGGSAPVICVGLLLILAFAIQLQWLPAFGMMGLAGSGGLGDRLSHLILPAVTLALLPALLTGQAVAREVTLPREGSGGYRLWLQGLFKGLGVLLGQMGGLLGASAMVETVFAWPGMGRITIEMMMRQDYPVLLGALSTYAGLVLVGRLAAELFHWLERLVRVPLLSPPPAPASWHKTARRVWVILALVLLLAPLGVAVAGLTVDTDEALQMDVEHVGEAPSDEHPWGTDRLGRDVQARVLLGGALTLGTTGGVAVLLLILAGPGGAVTGYLASRREWWSESLADLLLFPADVLLFIPAILAVLLSPVLVGEPGLAAAGLAVVVALLPRAVRFCQSLWPAAPEQRKGLMLGVVGPGALFLGSLFGGLVLLSALNFIGLGVQPPTPSLGGAIQEGMRMLRGGAVGATRAGVVLWACAFALYTAADALVGFFHTKDVMARLNE